MSDWRFVAVLISEGVGVALRDVAVVGFVDHAVGGEAAALGLLELLDDYVILLDGAGDRRRDGDEAVARFEG